MQLLRLLHKTLNTALPHLHKLRLTNVLLAVESALEGSSLTLTNLGRHLKAGLSARSSIKKMDRLLGNRHLHREAFSIYRYLSSQVLSCQSRPWIYIDWSCICSLTGLYVLRATLSLSGRGFVLYEECHPVSKHNHQATHRAFLQRLRALLPAGVHPIIVTDAGFRTPWFFLVYQLGWDFVGRLRHSKTAVYLTRDGRWFSIKDLYSWATHKACWLGAGLLTQSQQLPVQVVLYKGQAKKRVKLTHHKKKSQATKSKKYAQSYRQPWLLVTSLSSANTSAQQTLCIYRQRMHIEESFRDTKATHLGFGLQHSRSRSVERMTVLLLIAALATFACWLAGLQTRLSGKAHQYQAQSAKCKALSLVFLGRQVLKYKLDLSLHAFLSLITRLASLASHNQPLRGSL